MTRQDAIEYALALLDTGQSYYIYMSSADESR